MSEDTALGELADAIKARPDRACLAWMVAVGGQQQGGGPPDRVLLLEESAELAVRLLPRYECQPMSERARDAGGAGRQLHGVSVKRAALHRLLAALLFRENKKVEVYRKRSGRYELAAAGTPAAFAPLTEALLDEESAAAFGEEDAAEGGGAAGVDDDFSRPVAALSVERAADGFPRVGVFVLDRGARAVDVCSFADNHECDLLESVLESVSPLECRVPKNWDDDSGAGKVLLAKEIAVVKSETRMKKDFDEAVKGLDKYIDFSRHDLSVLEKDESQSVRTGLLLSDLLSSWQAEEGPNRRAVRLPISTFAPEAFVRLSASTLEGLHVFEGAKSLFSVLNRTRTAGGERLLRCWLRQPLRGAAAIRRRLDAVEALRAAADVRRALHERALRRVPDLHKVYKKLQTRRVGLQDLYKAYCAVRECGGILKELSDHLEGGGSEALEAEVVAPLSQVLPKLKKFEQLCEKTLDDEALSEGEYKVRASFDETLAELKEKMDAVRKGIQKAARKEANRLGVDFEKVLKLESSSQHGYFLRVTLKDERLLRQKSGVRVFDSTKAGVKFRTPPLESLNAEFEELSRSYEMHQQYIVDEILQIAEGYAQHLLSLYSVTSRLDCLVSFAVAADSAPLPYVKPDIVDEDEEDVLDLREARHPILEQMGVNVIPNDVQLDAKNNFKIITGPNLGGKSTYMRTAALCTFMAQIGSFVPCFSARLSPRHAILVRMGAADCQRRGVSTFMAEMLDAARILRHATTGNARSLVLVDELGRGTSTYDGFGLAWAIARRLAVESNGAFGLFATHFHEMTLLSKEVPNVSNLYCDALVKDNQFTLLYTIQPGTCHKSYGIEVARMSGFPPSVVAAAKQYYSESRVELRGALEHREEVDRLLKEHESAEEAGDDARKRKVREEAAQLAKRMRGGEEE